MLEWLPAIVIFIYLAVVLYIGIFAFRRGKETGEDFFLASRVGRRRSSSSSRCSPPT